MLILNARFLFLYVVYFLAVFETLTSCALFFTEFDPCHSCWRYYETFLCYYTSLEDYDIGLEAPPVNQSLIAGF